MLTNIAFPPFSLVDKYSFLVHCYFLQDALTQYFPRCFKSCRIFKVQVQVLLFQPIVPIFPDQAIASADLIETAKVLSKYSRYCTKFEIMHLQCLAIWHKSFENTIACKRQPFYPDNCRETFHSFSVFIWPLLSSSASLHCTMAQLGFIFHLFVFWIFSCLCVVNNSVWWQFLLPFWKYLL